MERMADGGSASWRPGGHPLVPASRRAAPAGGCLRRLTEDAAPDRARLPEYAGAAPAARLRAQPPPGAPCLLRTGAARGVSRLTSRGPSPPCAETPDGLPDRS